MCKLKETQQNKERVTEYINLIIKSIFFLLFTDDK